MNPIPQKLRKIIETDPYYRTCVLTGKTNELNKIDMHHSYCYSGRQINDLWNILPVYWKKHNYMGDKNSVHNCKETEEYVKYLALQRADIDDLCRRMPKFDWKFEFNRLKNKFEK